MSTHTPLQFSPPHGAALRRTGVEGCDEIASILRLTFLGMDDRGSTYRKCPPGLHG